MNSPLQKTWKTLLALAVLLGMQPALTAQVSNLPWDPDPDCNSIVTTGIVGVSCGTIEDVIATVPYSFGLVNLNGALPAAGRVDVSLQQDMYHHPSWHIDSLGNVFGITMDNCGNVYATASANYSGDFFGSVAVLRYGEIGGGIDDLEAAGTVYKIDGLTGQAGVFAVLPQQAYEFTHIPCEGFTFTDRFTGPGLGNIVYNDTYDQYYVSNFEDGRIYRLDANGTILDSFDPLVYDDGTEGPPVYDEIVYGLAIDSDDSRLFFGTSGDNSVSTTAKVYSIDLNPDGSFVGTVDNTTLPSGATYDNYVGDEILHYDVGPSTFGSGAVTVSDLEFDPNDILLVGARVGCADFQGGGFGASIHSSYNHGGRALALIDGGAGLYDVLAGTIYTSDGVLDINNAYGGVSYFENPNGGLEWIFSSADMESESGPHGIVTSPAEVYGSPNNPASPAGMIAYAPGLFDPKGMGGDVFVFKQCACEDVVCPDEVVANDLGVCSGEPFDLVASAVGGGEVTFSWTDATGALVDPTGIILTNDDCAPLEAQYFVTAVCVEDSSLVYNDTLTVQVLTDDLSSFITIIEEPCFVNIVIDSACAEFIAVAGKIPMINPGDVGSVDVEVIQTTDFTCNSLVVTLNYDCSCSLDSLQATPLECEDGMFMVEVDFIGTNTGGGFGVTDANGMDLGTFSYDELPVQVGPFLGDGSTVYTINVADSDFQDCAASITVGPVDCALECMASTGGPICAGAPLELFEMGGNAVTWTWSSDGDAIILDSLSQNTNAVNVTNGEVFTVTITDNNGLVETCSVVAVVNPLPEVVIESNDPVCAGEVIELSEVGGEATAWNWTASEGTIDDNSAQSILLSDATDSTLVSVMVTDSNGCVNAAEILVSVNPLPVCDATNDGPICDGDSLGLSENGGEAVEWMWTTSGAATIDDPSSQNPTATGVADGDIFTVVITDANGCMSTCETVAEVFANPTCIASNSGPICDSEPVMLSESGGDAVEWMWTSNWMAEFDDPTSQNPTATNITNGEIFTVVITTADGCTSTCQTIVTVNPLPVCEASNEGPICDGNPLVLSENGGDAVTWMWSTNGSAILDDPSSQNPTATGVVDGEVFTVIVTDENGCTSTCETIAEVFANPVCEATNDGPICEGAALGLNEEGGEAVMWMWTTNGSAVIDDPSSQNPTATNVTDGEVFTVVITDANGCTSSCETIAVVNDNAEVIASNNGPICVGDMLILSLEITGGTAPFMFTWTKDGEVISNNETVYISTESMEDAGVYEVLVVDANGCESMASTEAILNDNVTDPGEIAEDEYFCGPGADPSLIYEVEAPTGISGPIEYFWIAREEGGSWVMIPNADGPTYDPGIIYVTTEYRRCVRIDGCLLVQESNIVTKVIGDEVLADIEGPNVVCTNTTATYSVPAQSGTTYSWNFGPGASPMTATTNSVTVTWETMGVRTIQVEVENAACTGSNVFQVFVTNSPIHCPGGGASAPIFGQNEIDAPISLSVAPNPFQEELQVTLNQALEIPGQVAVTNLAGQVIHLQDLEAGTSRLSIDFRGQQNGVYFLQVLLDDGTVLRERVVKQ